MKLTSDEKTINAKKLLENNSSKTKKNFTGFYTKDDPVKIWGRALLELLDDLTHRLDPFNTIT